MQSNTMQFPKRLLYSCQFLSIYRAIFLVRIDVCRVCKKIFLSLNLAATMEYLLLFTLIIYLRAHI